MNNSEKIAGLRHFLARYGLPPERPPLPLGVAAADRALGGGLTPGNLQEIHAADWSAGGFAACLAIRAAQARPLFWVRPDYEALEYGALHPQGLMALGGRPDRLFLIKTPNATAALCAASDILVCPHVGALLLEISGNPAALDFLADRRLAFAAAASGVTTILLRQGARVLPGAAQNRWHVASAASGGQDDWGRPAFIAELGRNRLGPTGCWTMQWSPEDGLFRTPAQQHAAPNPGAVAAAAFHRPAEAQRRIAF